MSFILNCCLILFLIVADIWFTSIRPSWSVDDSTRLDEYIFLAVHIFVLILELAVVYRLLSFTVLFSAGLLGELSFALKPTIPMWLLRVTFAVLPWVYYRFIQHDRIPWASSVYAALYILNVLSCIGLSVVLMYVLCSLTQPHLYAPYHKKYQLESMIRIQRSGPPIALVPSATHFMETQGNNNMNRDGSGLWNRNYDPSSVFIRPPLAPLEHNIPR